MPYEERIQLNTGTAAADLRTKQFYAVTIDNTGMRLATAAKNISGILQGNPNTGETAQYAAAVPGSRCMAMIAASQALTLGALLEVGSGGTLVALASGTAVARAMENLTSVAELRVLTVEFLASNAAYA